MNYGKPLCLTNKTLCCRRILLPVVCKLVKTTECNRRAQHVLKYDHMALSVNTCFQLFMSDDPSIHFYLNPYSIFFWKGEMSFWKSAFSSECEVIGFFYVNLLTTHTKSIGHCEITKAIEPVCFTLRISIVRWSCEDKISSLENFLLWNGFLISEVNEDVSKWDEVLPNGIAFTSNPTWKRC